MVTSGCDGQPCKCCSFNLLALAIRCAEVPRWAPKEKENILSKGERQRSTRQRTINYHKSNILERLFLKYVYITNVNFYVFFFIIAQCISVLILQCWVHSFTTKDQVVMMTYQDQITYQFIRLDTYVYMHAVILFCSLRECVFACVCMCCSRGWMGVLVEPQAWWNLVSG